MLECDNERRRVESRVESDQGLVLWQFVILYNILLPHPDNLEISLRGP